jgi:Domain of unknown function (DUF4384)
MKHQRIPTWLFERIILDEVPPERADEVRHILESDPEARARLAELERSNAEILAELPPARVAAEVARRAETSRGYAFLFAFRRGGPAGGRPNRRLLALSSSLAVAGAVVVGVMVGRHFGPPDQGSETGEIGGGPVGGETGGGETGGGEIGGGEQHPAYKDGTAKGDPALTLQRMRGDDVKRVTSGDAVRAGDRIQIYYRPNTATYGVILSIDGRGHVEQHFPARENGSTRLERGEGGRASVMLSHSYELDDAPGFERFVFVTAARAIDLAAVRASADNLARDHQRREHDKLRGLPAGHQQFWYKLLKKEDAP